MEAAEIALSKVLTRLVRYRFSKLIVGTEEASDAAGEADHIERDFSRATDLLCRLQSEFERDVASHQSTAAQYAKQREYEDSILLHRQRLAALKREFSAFLARTTAAAAAPADDGDADLHLEQHSDSRDSITDGRSTPSSNLLHRSSGAPTRLPAKSAASAMTSAAALRRTRATMVRELERLSAVNALVEQDASSIDASKLRHLEYSGAVRNTYDLLWKQQREAWRSWGCVIFAFLLFAVVVAYIISSRVLWLFAGIAI